MTAPSVPGRTAALPAGGALPLLGFGTWQITGPAAQQAKSTDPERIRANADVDGFTLSPEDVAALDALGTA